MSGPINLGIHWDPNFQNRTEAGFQRLQKEADGEFIRLSRPMSRYALGRCETAPRTARCWAVA